MEFKTLLFEQQEGIAVITINRPDKLNALNKDVIEELSSAIDMLVENKEIRSAIITGAGAKAFVAGADISEFTTMGIAEGSDLALRGQTLVFDKIEIAQNP
jgi:enoyl-CoA hydratase